MSVRLPLSHPRISTRLVAFASGKGGVGKTVCASNLALHLAERSTVLGVDLDLGCGNLNASLGVRTVTHSINDFLGSCVPTLDALKTPTAHENLQLICCSYNPVEKTALASKQKDRLLQHLRLDDSDYVFMDLGAGVNDDILDLFAAADLRVLVTAPESLALHNAFVFVKSIVYRIVSRSLDQAGLSRRARDEIVKQLYENGDQEIARTVDQIREFDRHAADFTCNVLSEIRLHLILNKVQNSDEERYVRKLQELAKKYIDVELQYLGCIPFDENIKKSLNKVVPFALEYRFSPANAAFHDVALELERACAELTEDLDKPMLSTDSRAERLHDEERRQWLEEKQQLQKTIADLEARIQISSQRQINSEKKLEESLLLRDQFIERLQNSVEQQACKTRMDLAEKDAKIAELEATIRRFEDMLQSEGRVRVRLTAND